MFRKKKPSATISSDRIRAALSGTTRLTLRPRSERAATWADCEICWDGSLRGENGILMDISDTGARVRFFHRGIMPEEVRIIVPRLGLNRRASVVRRDETDIGLHFIDEAAG